MARTTDKDVRAAYKAALLDALDRIGGFGDCADRGVAFWAPAAVGEIRRQLAHPSLASVTLPEVAAYRGQVRECGTEDRALATLERERDAAVAQLRAIRNGKRDVRSEDREVGRFAADLERERDYWRMRCEALEGVTADPMPEDVDPRIVAAFDAEDCGFWHEGDPEPMPLAA